MILICRNFSSIISLIKTIHEEVVSVLGEAEPDDGACAARHHAHVVALAVHDPPENVPLEPGATAQASSGAESTGKVSPLCSIKCPALLMTSRVRHLVLVSVYWPPIRNLS